MDTKSIAERPDAQTQLRSHLHGMWAAVAGGWGEHADYTDARGRALSERMLELTRPGAGERVLELACGPGGVGLEAAARVRPTGEVVLSDVAAEMTAIAAARAAARGLTNVSTRELDLEQIDEPDAGYDVVLCREGLMFATDPDRATREIARVLRPGGRVAVAVWGPRARNPWLSLVLEAVGAELGRPVPPPGIPGPFSLEDADELRRLLADAGLGEVAVAEIPVPLVVETFEEWWTRTTALAGPLAKVLETLPAERIEAVTARLEELAAPYRTPAGLEFPGLSLVASGRRAAES